MSSHPLPYIHADRLARTDGGSLIWEIFLVHDLLISGFSGTVIPVHNPDESPPKLHYHKIPFTTNEDAACDYSGAYRTVRRYCDMTVEQFLSDLGLGNDPVAHLRLLAELEVTT